jgi:hypothetical protein
LLDGQISIDEVRTAASVAHAKGKAIVGVRLGASAPMDELEKYGFGSMPFKRNLIVSAVCRHDPVWMNDEGEPRDDQDMDHHKCKKQKVSDAAA